MYSHFYTDCTGAKLTHSSILGFTPLHLIKPQISTRSTCTTNSIKLYCSKSIKIRCTGRSVTGRIVRFHFSTFSAHVRNRSTTNHISNWSRGQNEDNSVVILLLRVVVPEQTGDKPYVYTNMPYIHIFTTHQDEGAVFDFVRWILRIGSWSFASMSWTAMRKKHALLSFQYRT